MASGFGTGVGCGLGCGGGGFGGGAGVGLGLGVGGGSGGGSGRAVFNLKGRFFCGRSSSPSSSNGFFLRWINIFSHLSIYEIIMLPIKKDLHRQSL
jgi:hypothetical protein